MSKNNLIRALSLILVFVMIFGVYGCKKNESSGKNNASVSDDNYDIKPVQPSIENGTAVVSMTSIDENGKKVDVTKEIKVNDARPNVITQGSSLKDKYKTEDEKKSFIDGVQEDFGIDKDKAEEIINKAEDWVEFYYDIYIVNTNSKRICMRYAATEKKDNNIIISTNLDCEHSIPTGVGSSIGVKGYVNISKYSSTEALEAAIKKMGLKIPFTLLSGDATDVDDWSAVTTAYMPVSTGEISY